MAADPLDQLQKLAELRSLGIVSDHEFTSKKVELLSQVGASSARSETSSNGKSSNSFPSASNSPPSLPIVSATDVEISKSQAREGEEILSDLEVTANRVRGEMRLLESRVRSTKSVLAIRRICDRFPLGRIGALIIVPAIAAGVVAVLCIGVRLGAFSTTLLVILGTITAAAICVALNYWRSDAEIIERELDLQRQLTQIQRAVEMADQRVQQQFAIFADCKNRYEAILSAFQSRQNRLLSSDWRSMRGIPFEEFLLETFRELGFQCELTRASGDQGVDLIAIRGDLRLAIQAKGYAESVGNKAVQEAHAGMTFYQCNQALVITNSTFTNSAIELASRLDCRLIDGSQIPNLVLGKFCF